MNSNPDSGNDFSWIVLLLLVATIGCQGGSARTPIANLIDRFESARRQPAPSSFDIASVAIGSETKRAVLAKPVTRLTYHVTVPTGARFDVSAAVHPSAWDATGAATLFIVGVSDGHWYQNKASFVIDPAQPENRRWHPVTVDLDEFAGLTIDLILNTRPAGATVAGEPFVGVWGTPVVSRR